MLSYILSTLILCISAVSAADRSDLVGTWTSKSNAVLTGSGFYDPIDELLIEPALTGISYSFTEDGFFEEALYQVTPNPRDHTCPSAVLIFQHGTYTLNDTGELTLEPFSVDGRQLLSEPCQDHGRSTYSRYNQTEGFRSWNVYVDPYHGRYRLDLVKSTGPYVQPLYLAYRPPQMLPTITLNPTATAGPSAYVGDGASSGRFVANTETVAPSSTAARAKREVATAAPVGFTKRVKRSLENRYRTNAVRETGINYDLWWWTSVGLMVVGGAMFMSSR